MNNEEKQYLDILEKIIKEGNYKENRTGINTYSIFGTQMRFSLENNFPLLTTKKVHTKSIIHELLWIISGNTNIKYLQDNGVRIWNEWSDENGDLGPVYGHQWRKFPNYVNIGFYVGRTPHYVSGTQYYENNPIDQLLWAQNRLRTNPDCRRIIVTAWNPADLPKQALAPCHCFYQFYTHIIPLPKRLEIAQKMGIFIDYAWKNKEDGHSDLNNRNVPERYLSCQMYQRSNDTFLGVPFNIASYALLTNMMAQCVNMIPYEFIHTGGDVHIYENHLEQTREQLSRTPYDFPQLELNKEVKEITDFKFEDIEIKNYQCHPSIKGEVAV